ncbi:HlyD family secretion protein [Tuwongella immobilis]|uniref:YbhG-like alpha-helical hairpin domain-containing protein n=1 Tax=Tuwongella immobilis TaxID=692036 RepID=A0A6C2YJI5_9BACT|nr:HlyD family efflux transporter periplasmic adaptor subunit [Tuwongella immobilis]VIP01576.1 Secretion protein HlyD family protein OS=Planctomyces limnophilus (strain ATCC 43296 / DSM 3776 / IFAM 1008 / 290) GN=Plim_0471 PE=4 SV=1: HlyD [Tuwongella immobilis]VTR98818.1 Secretion protein HlyD family protein OS=Planctomyces limnophilus (strain ATCC 43296 / DSM 3776 / IFAM 1008 / 290) GN=Plim_0471 PE=4 SV=1: HlyD [Tuwongella immobilis]
MRGKMILPILALGMLGFAVMHVVRANQEKPRPELVVEPARSSYETTLAGTGIVEPRSENIAIGSPLPGVVDEVMVRVGDAIQGPDAGKPGTPLFRLDDRQLRAELRLREANLAAAKANLRKLEMLPRPEEVPAIRARVTEAKASMDELTDAYERAKKLFAGRSIGEEELISKRQAMLNAQAQLARADADLALLLKGAWEPDLAIARAAVEQAEAQRSQTLTELERLTVRAPISGQVIQRNIRPGEFVGTPPSQALLVVGDVSVLHVRVDIDENDIPRFRSGVKGHAVPRGNAQVKLPMQFVRVEPYVVPKKSLSGASSERVDTRVLQVIFALDTGTPDVYVGQQVDIFLDTSEKSAGSSK